MATASTGVGVQLYMPVKLLLSRDTHLQVMTVGLEAANAVLPSPFCTNPMLLLVALLTISRAMLDSLLVEPKDKA